jgi:hypothetical protein
LAIVASPLPIRSGEGKGGISFEGVEAESTTWWK